MTRKISTLAPSLPLSALLFAATASAQGVAAAPCVEFGKPKPAEIFSYRRSDSGGAKTEYSHRWTEFLPERTSQRVVRAALSETVVNLQSIADDVTMIAASTSTSPKASARTAFQPAVTGDPMLRACAGRSWKIPAVTATHSEGGHVATAQTYAGTLRIVSLHETIKVPAGEFACVHYTRTLGTPRGPTVEEYWKSIDHGVVVRQVSKLGAWSSTSELVAIK